jgi:UDPglucose 6-dehydrogenase
LLKKEKKIGIIGLWHLGCVLAAAWSKKNHIVSGFDHNKDRVENLTQGHLPIYEPGLEKNIKQSVTKNLLFFSDNIKTLSNSDFIFLSYDTPVLENDDSDISILVQSVKEAAIIMKDNSVLIISSQTPVGLCTELRQEIKKINDSLDLAYSPENLRLGEALDCYINPGRIILGTANKETEEKCISLFQEISKDIIVMNLESAELVKHGINSFLATSIVFANHLADICEEMNADIKAVASGMKSDPRIGNKAYLSPGIGFSGGTLGRDLFVLNKVNSQSEGQSELFGIIHNLNQKRKFSIIKKIDKIVGGLQTKNIGVLGLTYKPGTSTLRRSLPLEIINLLVEKGANVFAYDSKADYSELNINPTFNIVKEMKEVIMNTDIVVLLTEWPEFREYDWKINIKRMKQKRFFDTKNFLDKNFMKNIGFEYHSIGCKE